MTKVCTMLLAICLLLGCTPPPRPASLASLPAAPVSGIGACHHVPSSIQGTDIGWGYENSVGAGVLAREINPSPGVYDFESLDAFVGEFIGSGVKLWLSIQTVDEDLNGNPKAPAWWIEDGAVWHKGGCSRGGIFAAWDDVYLGHLTSLLEQVNIHISAQSPAYRDTIGGIVMMSGGLYGEMQLFSCDMEATLKDYYNLTDAAFLSLYGDAVVDLVDVYAASFPQWPLMLQMGFHRTTEQVVIQHGVVQEAVDTYGDQVLLKWNGLDPDALANDIYVELFTEFAPYVQVGYEPGHPEFYKTNGEWDPAKFQKVFGIALKACASFMCFQPGGILEGVQTIPGWREFDAALEANAAAAPTPVSFYNIGWYSDIWYPWLVPPQAPPSSDKLAGFAHRGMPIVLTYTYSENSTGDYLDEAERVGMVVMVEIPRKWTGRGGSLNIMAISNYVNAHKSHSALWGWYMGDEPEFAWDASGQQANHWASPQTLGRIYDTIKATDDHPVTIVNWARPRVEYVDTFDVYMNDWYPRDCKLPYTGSCVGSNDIGEFNYMTRSSYNVWKQGLAFVEQNGKDGYMAVAWGQDYDRAANPKPGMRDMSPEEFRYHVYTAVVQGAGVFFWKEGWADSYVKGLVYDLVAEVQSIGAAMNNGTTNVLTVNVPDTQLVHRYGSDPESHVILAVNIDGHDNAYNVDPDTVGQPLTNVTFQLPYTTRPAFVEVVGENRTLPVTSANTIIDNFDRYEAHIYRWPWGSLPTATPSATPTLTATTVSTSTPTATATATAEPTATSTPTVMPTATMTSTVAPIYFCGVCDPGCRAWVVTPEGE